jgi:hypothetical protein
MWPGRGNGAATPDIATQVFKGSDERVEAAPYHHPEFANRE